MVARRRSGRGARHAAHGAGLLALQLACTSLGPEATVIGSATSGQLLTDATQMVMVVDAARAPDCGEPRQITAEPVNADNDELRAERWKVERCGSVKFYRIRYRAESDASSAAVSVQEEAPPPLDKRRKQRFDPR